MLEIRRPGKQLKEMLKLINGLVQLKLQHVVDSTQEETTTAAAMTTPKNTTTTKHNSLLLQNTTIND